MDTALPPLGAEEARSLLGGIAELAHAIAAARQELRALRAEDGLAGELRSATDELDAVIEATETASHRIMDAADVIQAHAAEPAAQAAVMDIYEACSFQDITGQRIRKVVGLLQLVDGRIHQLLTSFGEHGQGARAAVIDPREGEAALLNGPQLPGHGIGQNEVDRLLAELG